MHGYGAVLALVVLLFVVQESVPDTTASRLIVVWLAATTLVVAVHVARASHAVARIGAFVAGVVAVFATATALLQGDVSDGLTAIASGLLVGIAPVVIGAGLVRDLRVTKVVMFHTLAGVLAIYMLMGMFFSFVYSAIDHLTDQQFFAEVANPERSDFLYFSYVTLTTTGFGDLTAAVDLGRTFVVTEALFGQIYLVTVVTLIVSNLRPGAGRAQTPS